MRKYLAFILLGLLSLNALAQQPRPLHQPPRKNVGTAPRFTNKSQQMYSFETPGAREMQVRLDLALETGSLKFSTETQTQRVEGVNTEFSAAFGISDMLSLGARGSYLNSTSGGTVASTSRASASKSGMGDAEIFMTTRIAPSSLQMYLTLTGGIKTADFEVDNLSGNSTNSSGGYYVEPRFAASMALGSVLIGGAASYRYHFSRELKYTSTYGTETLRLDPGNIIKAKINTEIQTSYPFGAEVEYISEDRHEAISLATPGGTRLTFGNTTSLVGSAYVRFPTDLGFGEMQFVPWVSYMTNLGKKRGIANVDEDQILSLMLKLQMQF